MSSSSASGMYHDLPLALQGLKVLSHTHTHTHTHILNWSTLSKNYLSWSILISISILSKQFLKTITSEIEIILLSVIDSYIYGSFSWKSWHRGYKFRVNFLMLLFGNESLTSVVYIKIRHKMPGWQELGYLCIMIHHRSVSCVLQKTPEMHE